MSTVPSFSFCSSSLSPPSWLEPYTTTLALAPSLALACLANSSAEAANSEPGSPTWPNLISVWAKSGAAKPASSAAAMVMRNFIISPPWLMSGCSALWLRVALGEIRHGRLDPFLPHRHPGEPEPHLDACEGAHQHEIVEIAQVADTEHLAAELGEPGAKRQVEGLEDHLTHPVGVLARGYQDARERG